MADASRAQVPVLTANEWGAYVRGESRLFIEAVSAELASNGVAPARTARDATMQRVALLFQELHDSLVEFGVRPEVATVSLRQITERPPEERLERLEQCVALVRFLPSRGESRVLRLRGVARGLARRFRRMTALLAVLRTVAEEAPAPCSVASFEQRLLLSCETLPAASILCMEKVSAQVQRASRTRPDGLVLTVEEPVVPTPHSQHPLACAARRTMRAVTWRYRRLMRRLPDLLALLQQCAADTRVSRTMGSRNERLCHSWALAPDASRATRAAVDAVLSRASLSVTRLSGAMEGDPPPAVPRADGVPAAPLPRRNVLDRAFIRGEAQARLDEPSSAGGY